MKKCFFKGLLKSEDGATSAEYAIMASLIAAAIAGAVYLLGTAVLNLFSGFQLP